MGLPFTRRGLCGSDDALPYSVREIVNANVFCTYFDKRYLTRGLALHRSLETHATGPFVLWVLCLDELTHDVLSELRPRGVRLIRLVDLEQFDPGLAKTRADRSLLEYYWTCTPSLLLYVFERDATIETVSYLDSDLYFFGDPEAARRELGGGSVLIVPHRFPPALEHQLKYGTFNVGLISFRQDANGQASLRWWRERCVEWCRDDVHGDRYGDQRYLDAFPSRFTGVVAAGHKGIGLGPWNCAGNSIALQTNEVFVGGERLIFYHFHGLRLLGRWLYDPGSYPGVDRTVRRYIYRPYLNALRRAWNEIRPLIGGDVGAADPPRWPWGDRASGWRLASALARGQVHLMPPFR
jgi:hypothetical protein